jgi:hypothetical protein
MQGRNEEAGAAEREFVVVYSNDTAVPYPPDQSVHGVFETQVERQPNALAVVWGSKGSPTTNSIPGRTKLRMRFLSDVCRCCEAQSHLVFSLS